MLQASRPAAKSFSQRRLSITLQQASRNCKVRGCASKRDPSKQTAAELAAAKSGSSCCMTKCVTGCRHACCEVRVARQQVSLSPTLSVSLLLRTQLTIIYEHVVLDALAAISVRFSFSFPADLRGCTCRRTAQNI